MAMNSAERSAYAAEILNNPVWQEIREKLPQTYYNEFSAATGDLNTRSRISLAHDIFNDVVDWIETSFKMGAQLELPDEVKTGDSE
jgi:hypothetical protein